MRNRANSSIQADFLVVGGGVIGLSLASRLKSRFADATVVLIEKEPRLGEHASGRNSGVLHAGFYYSADSLKARFTKAGNQALRQYCQEHSLRLNLCGKLVVARNEHDLPGLDELLRRGNANGIVVEKLTAREAKGIEPRVKTYEYALYSPSTAVVDPLEVLQCMAAEARAKGVRIVCDTRYLGLHQGQIKTSKGRYAAGYVVNAAGLYADKIARDFGFGEDFYLLPFKGLYLQAGPGAAPLRAHVYPVPDLAQPFLGVHFTVTVDGRSKIGPTALPAFWREQYGWGSRFKAGEFVETALNQLRLLSGADVKFGRLALRELRKCRRAHLVKRAGELLEAVGVDDYRDWGKPGMRAQLVSKSDNKWVMDFVAQGDGKSMHVLNSVSPAFTCSLPFARYLVNKIEALL